MKTITVRLPEVLAEQIGAEARARMISKSEVVRDRLQAGADAGRRRHAALDAIRDLVGSIDGLPADLSARSKMHLKASGYGRKRPR